MFILFLLHSIFLLCFCVIFNILSCISYIVKWNLFVLCAIRHYVFHLNRSDLIHFSPVADLLKFDPHYSKRIVLSFRVLTLLFSFFAFIYFLKRHSDHTRSLYFVQLIYGKYILLFQKQLSKLLSPTHVGRRCCRQFYWLTRYMAFVSSHVVLSRLWNWPQIDATFISLLFLNLLASVRLLICFL